MLVSEFMYIIHPSSVKEISKNFHIKGLSLLFVQIIVLKTAKVSLPKFIDKSYSCLLEFLPSKDRPILSIIRYILVISYLDVIALGQELDKKITLSTRSGEET